MFSLGQGALLNYCSRLTTVPGWHYMAYLFTEKEIKLFLLTASIIIFYSIPVSINDMLHEFILCFEQEKIPKKKSCSYMFGLPQAWHWKTGFDYEFTNNFILYGGADIISFHPLNVCAIFLRFQRLQKHNLVSILRKLKLIELFIQ